MFGTKRAVERRGKSVAFFMSEGELERLELYAKDKRISRSEAIRKLVDLGFLFKEMEKKQHVKK